MGSNPGYLLKSLLLYYYLNYFKFSEFQSDWPTVHWAVFLCTYEKLLVSFCLNLSWPIAWFFFIISYFFHFFFFQILERLAESLRTIPTSPTVQSAVFLCFRVILIRMSPQRTCSSHVFTNPEFSFYNCFFFFEKKLSVR